MFPSLLPYLHAAQPHSSALLTTLAVLTATFMAVFAISPVVEHFYGEGR